MQSRNGTQTSNSLSPYQVTKKVIFDANKATEKLLETVLSLGWIHGEKRDTLISWMSFNPFKLHL